MNNLKGKRLLILGGSKISCEIVKKAKSMGLYTVVTDWYSLEDSPAKQIADKEYQISIADTNAIVNLIISEKIDGVITGYTDSALPHYAKICEAAGLPCYGTLEQFETFINKSIYKKLCRKFGVPVVEEYQINEESLQLSFDDSHIEYPVIVKPADNSGGRGVSICRIKEELVFAYNNAKKYSESNKIIVERFVSGKEVTIFYTLQNGQTYLAAMANRHVRFNQEESIAMPVAYTYPSIYLDPYKAKIEPRVKEMFRSMGMKNGIVFMQCLVENGECLVYDIGYRLTGTLEYKLFEKICGFNTLEMLINFSITGKMADYSLENKVDPYWNKYACSVSFLVKPGSIKKIQGIKRILNLPQVVDIFLSHEEGSEIPESARGTLKQIILRVFATANTPKELENILNKIYGQLKVTSDDGENLLLAGFDTNELGGLLI